MSIYLRKGRLIRIFYGLISCVVWVAYRMVRKRTRCVLCYHGISSKWKDRFALQVQSLSRMRGPSIPASENSIANCRILPTFDDAFANLLDNAIPILERYRVPAVIFAVADNMGNHPRWTMPCGHPEIQEPTMKAAQLLEISKNPLIRIGSHTMTHPDLATIPEDRLRFELAESKRKLETIVGYPIEDLALPHGSYNDQVLLEALQAGYKRIYTLDPIPYDQSSGNPLIGRFSMSPDLWRMEFRLTCAGAYSWLYPWRKVVRGIRTLLPIRK